MKPEIQFKIMKLAEIRLEPGNPRKMSEEKRDRLRRSIRELGFKDPVTVDQDLILIDGYHRLNIAWELGLGEVPAVIVNIEESKRRILGLALNSIKGEWNIDVLKETLVQLEEGGLDVSLAGLDEDVLKSLEAAAIEEIPIEEDQFVPDKSSLRDVKRGQIFQLGSHRVMCGDSTKPEDVERLMEGKRAAMAFTDPPYGVDYDSGALGRSQRQWKHIENDSLKEFDLEAFCEAFLRAMLDSSQADASFYICFANRTAHRLIAILDRMGIHYAVPIVWDKEHITITWDRYHPQHEMIFYCGEGSKPTGQHSRWFGPKNETTVWRIKRDPSQAQIHPTQKPVALAARAILNSSRPGEIVLDLFGGSGSTLIACEKTNRVSYTMEIDPGYVAASIARWENLTHRQAEMVGPRTSESSDPGNRLLGVDHHVRKSKTG